MGRSARGPGNRRQRVGGRRTSPNRAASLAVYGHLGGPSAASVQRALPGRQQGHRKRTIRSAGVGAIGRHGLGDYPAPVNHPSASRRPDSAPGEQVAAPDRLEAVDTAGPPDTEPEEPFDRLTRLAATVVDAPVAFVTLINGTRCYWKSYAGAVEKAPPGRQTPLEGSLFREMIDTGQPVVMSDATRDNYGQDDFLVRTAGLVAWAAFPVHHPNGQIVGAFGAADSHPRSWTQRDRTVLQTLAQAVSGEISLRYTAATAAALARTLQESLLPPEIPRLPGLEVSARYRPAGEGSESSATSTTSSTPAVAASASCSAT